MQPEVITSVADPRVSVYSSLTEAQLRNSLHPEQGVFIAESPKVISVALDAGLEPLSLLCERRHIDGDAAPILERLPGNVPVYTGSREVLASITGYTLTRGVLCAMRRPALPDPAMLCREAKRVAVIDDVSDTTNIGAIFRSAAALGIDAVLLTPTACDPLNRRSVRVSMGSVFLVPWTRLSDIDILRECGFKTAALALRFDSVSIDDPVLKKEERLALILGSEGYGLPEESIRKADYVVKIPMHHGVDSLNVAAAAAVAFYEICR